MIVFLKIPILKCDVSLHCGSMGSVVSLQCQDASSIPGLAPWIEGSRLPAGHSICRRTAKKNFKTYLLKKKKKELRWQEVECLGDNYTIRLEPSYVAPVPSWKRPQRTLSLSFRRVRIWGEDRRRRGRFPEPDHAGIPVLDFKPPELRKIGFYYL